MKFNHNDLAREFSCLVSTRELTFNSEKYPQLAKLLEKGYTLAWKEEFKRIKQ